MDGVQVDGLQADTLGFAKSLVGFTVWRPRSAFTDLNGKFEQTDDRGIARGGYWFYQIF
jgi:hypothetical protein